MFSSLNSFCLSAFRILSLLPLPQFNRKAPPRQQPAGTDKTIIGSRHDQPVRSDVAAPQNAEGQGLNESRQAETRERRPSALTASISAFLGTSAGVTRGAERTAVRQPTPKQRPEQRPGNLPPTAISPQAAEPDSRYSHREPSGKPWRHRRPAARTQPRSR